MNTTQANGEWIPLQVKVFSRWVSSHLTEGKADVQVNDITKDLSNGVALVELAKILIGKDTPRKWVHEPKRTVEMVQNCDLSIEMFEKDGVHLVGISGKDINDNKEKLILGYIWTLILKYSIGQSVNTESSKTNTSSSVKKSKDALMQWAIDRTSNYPNIHNFHPYDLSMCALLDSYVPEKINYYQLDPKDSKRNAQLATDVMNELGVPVYVYPDDYEGNQVDEKALLTQLSTAKVNLEKLPPPQKRIRETNVESAVSDFNKSTVVTEKVSIEEGQIIPDPNGVEQTNIESVVENFNQSSKFNEEVIQDGLEAESALEGINLYSNESQNNNSTVSEEESSTDSDSDDDDVQSRNVTKKEFVPTQVVGDNIQYSERKFGLIMTLNESDYNDGKKVDLEKDELLFGEDIQFALTMVKDKHPYLNPAGLKLSLAKPDIENDVFQQFTFGKNQWCTVIDSVQQRGMVWDVADEFSLNPPSGTPFYLFMFHGRHNQHFIYKDNMIYAKQNGQVVTFVGGDVPLVMMPPSNRLKARQTFSIKLL